MNSRATTGENDRLVDYFAVVGLGTDLEPIDNMTGMPIETADGTPPRDMTFRAETRHRFPLVDYDAPPYPTGVGLFCFPDGLKLSFGYPPMPTFFTFVATGGTGTKLYGHCLTIHEPLTPSQAASYTKASEAARAVRAARASMEAKQARELGRLASDRDHHGGAAVAGAVSSPPGTPRAATNSVRQAEGLPALGPSPTSATIPEDANERGGGGSGSGGSDSGSSARSDLTGSSPIVVGDADDVYSALAGDGDHAHSGRRASGASNGSAGAATASDGTDGADANGSTPTGDATAAGGAGESAGVGEGEGEGATDNGDANGGLSGMGASAFDLLGGEDEPKASKVYAPTCLVILSQWYFPAFRDFLTKLYQLSLSAMPVPVERIISNFCLEVPLPPAGRVEVQYQIANDTLTFCRPPPNRRCSPLGLPMHDVFECLSLESIVTIMSAIMLERQIIIVSSQLSLLTAAAEVLCSLAYPLLWCHVYIPVLPRTLVQVLQAPMPFIVGISSKTYALVQVPSHVVRVELDHNKVACGTPIVPLPPKQRTKLLRELRKCANAYDRRAWDWGMHELPSKDSAFKNAARPSDMPRAEAGTTIDWEETRRLFLKVFTHNLYSYRSCLIYPDANIRDRFDKRKFIHEVHKKVPSSHQFLEALLETQLFQNFVDDRIQPDEDDVDVIYFDEEILKKEARHFGVRRFLKKSETPFLDSTEFEIGTTKVALTPDVAGVTPDQSFSYERFPDLDVTQYTPPRYVEPLINAKDSASRHQFRRKNASGQTDAQIGVSASEESNVYAIWFNTCCAAIGHARVAAVAAQLDAYKLEQDEVDGVAEADVAQEVLQATEAVATAAAAKPPPPPAAAATANGSGSGEGGEGGANGNGTADGSGDSSTGVETADHATPPHPPPAAPAAAPAPSPAPAPAPAPRPPQGHLTRRSSITSFLGVPGGTLDISPAERGWGLATFLHKRRRLRRARASLRIDAIDTFPAMLVDSPRSLDSPDRGGAAAGGAGVGAGAGAEADADAQVEAAAAAAAAAEAEAAEAARKKKKKKKKKRGKLRRSSVVDLKQQAENERLQKQQLDVAFAVLDRMKRERVDMLEIVFRSLIEACGRCGDGERALDVTKTMNKAGFVPDSSVYNCVFRSFTMNAQGNSLTTWAQFDWNQFRGQEESAQEESKQQGIIGRLKTRFFRRPSLPDRPPRPMYGAGQPFPDPHDRTAPTAATVDGGATAGSDASSVAASGDVGAGTGAGNGGSGGPGAGRGGGGDTRAPPPVRTPQVEEPGDISTPTARSRGSMMSWLRSWRLDAKDLDSVVTKAPPGSHDALREEKLLYQGSDMHKLSHCSPGFGFLGKVFPDLTIDTNRETCPRCNQKVLDTQIQEGWRRDADDYTTACPYPECAAANGTDECKTASASPRKRGKDTPEDGPPKNAVRFVARFAVSSKAPFWEGSTGTGSKLFCEYLAPWVLMKQLQKALSMHGEAAVCTPQFRHKSPTVFWNLVWYFEKHRLPLDFVVPDVIVSAYHASLPGGLRNLTMGSSIGLGSPALAFGMQVTPTSGGDTAQPGHRRFFASSGAVDDGSNDGVDISAQAPPRMRLRRTSTDMDNEVDDV